MDETATLTLDGEALAGIERSLHGKLRAHHISDSFFDRYGEDAVQKGLVEYLRATADGVEVREPGAFVLQAAFRRAIDELRREARRADGDALEQFLESGRSSAPPAEDEAIANIEADRLQDSIDSLSLEERRILALHCFEEVGQRRAAELLFMSERTFRRRLKRAQAHLARLLGAPDQEPDTHRGLEIGLAAWAGLGGGPVVASGAAGHLVAALESARAGAVRLLERLRGPGTRLAASEAPERIGAIAGGPAGKFAGGCAGMAALCVLSGVIGPGLDLGGGPNTARPVSTHHIAAAHALRHPIHQITVDPQGQPASRLQAAEPAETHDTSPSPTKPAARRRHPDTEQREPKKAEKAPLPTAEGRTQVVEEGQSRREEFGAFEGRDEQPTAEPEVEAAPEPDPPRSAEPGPNTSEEESATTSSSSEANRQFGFGR